MKSRTVTVYYEDDNGEHPFEVSLYREGRHAVVDSDLSELPEDQIESVRYWAIDKFWDAERTEYLRSIPADMDDS